MTTKCVASHYAHDCSDPAQCRQWLAVLLANAERREQRAAVDREAQAIAEVAAATKAAA